MNAELKSPGGLAGVPTMLNMTPHDRERLEPLRAPIFDALSETARILLDAPGSMITGKAGGRYFIRTQAGFTQTEQPGRNSFFDCVVEADDILVVLDARSDNRFFDNICVNHDHGFRFVVGLSLKTLDGDVLGVLCVTDPEVRRAPSEKQLRILQKLADAAIATIEVEKFHAQMRRNSALLQATLDSISQGVSAFDADLRLVSWNARMGELMNISPEIIRQGMHYSELGSAIAAQGALGPGDHEKLVAERVAQLKSSQSCRRDMVFDSGRIVEVYATPLPTGGFVSTHTDVTAERQRERELKVSAIRFKTEGAIAAVANEAPNLFAALTKTLSGSCFELGLHFGRINIRRADCKKLVATGITYQSSSVGPRHLIQSPSSLVRAALETGHPVYTDHHPDIEDYPADQQGAMAFPLKILADTYVIECFGGTPVKECTWHATILPYLGQQLSRVAERDQLYRMKDEFISTMNHEMRTPLTAISGALDLLQAEMFGPLSSEAKEMIGIACENSQRLGRLIEDVLDLDRMETDNLTISLASISLRASIAEACHATENLAIARNVRIEVENPDGLTAIAQSARFGQIMRNLLSNAIKFSPPGEVVRIKVGKHGSRVRVSVIDFGPGIPEDYQPKIFTKFTQADGSDSRRASGAGLGLAIVKEIADRLGARVSYHTAKDVGTSFHVDLLAE